MLASGDSWSLVAWQDSGAGYWDIHAVRVSHAGVVLDNYSATLNPVYCCCENPAIARNGDQYLVTWIDRPTGSHGVFGALVRWPGLHPETTQVTVMLQNYWYTRPPVAFDGRDYYVAYRYDVAEILCTQVTPSGGVLGPYPLVAGLQDGYPGNMAAGVNGSMLLVYATTTDSVNGYPAKCWRIWGLLSVRFVGVAENGGPARVGRLECTPNPFTRSALIRFNSVSAGPGRLRIYDVSGRTVRCLTAGTAKLTSPSTLVWDGLDDSGRPARPGCYFVRLECDGIPSEAKLVRSH
jgi:hypothetical protein